KRYWRRALIALGRCSGRPRRSRLPSAIPCLWSISLSADGLDGENSR
ncbi:hypothetical protein JMJ77_0010843, partial [Colletotrichum scovillei]